MVALLALTMPTTVSVSTPPAQVTYSRDQIVESNGEHDVGRVIG
jgi:hypothetical protein